MSFNDKHHANAVLARSERKAAEYEGDYRCAVAGGPEDPCRNLANKIFREPFTPNRMPVMACDECAVGLADFGYEYDASATVELRRDIQREKGRNLNVEDGFTRAWAEAPQSYKRLVEMETAEFFYRLGVRDGHALATVTINADLKEAVRVAQERITR